MMTQFKIKPGQVFYIKTLLSEGNKYYPLEISRVTAKCVFFTFDGINRRGELKTDKYGNQYFTKYCPECLVGVYHHTPMVNPDEPTEVETMENPNIDAEYTLGQAVIRCHGKDEKTLLGTVTEIDGGMFIVTCLDGIEYWEDDLNLVPDTEFNRATYGLSTPQTSVKSEPVSNVIDMFTRKPLVVDETEVIETVKTERRELIDQFNHYSILLNNTEYDTEKWNAIFDKTQELRAAIEKLG